MPAHRAAFTLLEICLVLAIGMVLIMLAVPSIAGVFAERRLHDSYERFERLADSARSRSIQEQKAYHLVWDKGGVVASAMGAKKGEIVEEERMNLEKGETFQVERIASLARKPPAAEWTFWPNGTCEPVIVSYAGPAGKWRVRFDAFSSHGIFLESETP